MAGFDKIAIPDDRSKEGKVLREGISNGEVTRESLARAERRLAEIRANMPDGGEVRDKFWAPEPPAGFDYQWKRRTIYGQEDPAYWVELTRQGWEPVPLSRHSQMMPNGWKGKMIEVEGMVLMERPMVLTEEARLRERLAAREAVLTKEQQLSSTREGDLGRREVLRFSKTREPITVPDSDE